ncbi:hypothetical protein H9L15_08755 [Sphingomonas daechungensis]|uniref:PilZ domain-containing protein n=1 Tax=Sphingomonas daechungensis TaxID=1176646 RepID=A0ABX6SYY1_9SPHN|nr:hypothetical protein [Sphingomonas daechungensis]QNP42404.1 hypothetical protein H9L15_08755 [Sphingomonas daechungensis]
MIRARMRSSSAWHDVCILNVSLHGLGVQSAEPPARGTYVEIRRGRQTIVARVAWNKGHRAGLRSQDPIFLTALLNDTSGEAPAAGKVQGLSNAATRHDRPILMPRAALPAGQSNLQELRP